MLKDWIFLHTPVYDDSLLSDIGMDSEFLSIWKAAGWDNIHPITEYGSYTLTIQFLCTLRETYEGISVRLFGNEYAIFWKDLSKYLGFHQRCSLDLVHATKGFNKDKFWEEITGQVHTGKYYPRNAHIQHPTLRFLHLWLSITMFPSQDTRVVRVNEMRLLYAARMKIKVAPVQEIVRHWLDIIKTTTPISLTSLITRVATAIGALEGQDLDYIQIPRTMINETYLIQGHHLKRDNAGGLVFYFPGYTNVIRLPNPGLRLYNSGRLTFDLQTAETARRRSVYGRDIGGSSSQPPPSYTQPIYQSGWDTPMPTQGVEGWAEADSSAWEQQSRWRAESPEEHPSASTVGRTDLERLQAQLGGLVVRTDEIQDTLQQHIQTTDAHHQQAVEWHQQGLLWQQQQQAWHQQQQEEMQARQDQLLKQSQDFWRYMGYNPDQ
jgi:hypothetical protein